MSRVTWQKVGLVAILAVALVAGATAYAKRPGGGSGTGCPKNMACPDIWDPVQCADGVVYSSQCHADAECAPKPCTSVGGPVEY